MKQIFCFLLISVPVFIFAQSDTVGVRPAAASAPKQKKESNSIGLGIKAGLNFTNITSASQISNKSETGYQVGIFFDPTSHSLIGSRTELLYSHQGYNYASGQTTGKVYLDYVMLAQLMVLNITHFVQIQVGTQIAYLLNAKADSSNNSAYGSYGALLNYYNRIDFGFSGGVEVRPFMGIIVGARYNFSVTNLYKVPDLSNPSNNTPPSFIPSTSDLNFKNNLIQIYLGYRF